MIMITKDAIRLFCSIVSPQLESIVAVVCTFQCFKVKFKLPGPIDVLDVRIEANEGKGPRGPLELALGSVDCPD